MTYSEKLDSYREEIIKTLGESISCPSVNSEAARTADGEVYPFGKGVQDALEHMLKTIRFLPTGRHIKVILPLLLAFIFICH